MGQGVEGANRITNDGHKAAGRVLRGAGPQRATRQRGHASVPCRQGSSSSRRAALHGTVLHCTAAHVMDGFQMKGRPSAARAAWYTPKLRRKPRTAQRRKQAGG